MPEFLNAGHLVMLPSSNGGLGGVVQSGELKSQSFNALTNVTGVTIFDGYVNDIAGLASLFFTATPVKQVQHMVTDAALESGDQYFVDVDDISLSQVFVTSNDNTLDLLATKIALEANVDTAVRSGTRTIVVTGINDSKVKLDAIAISGATPPVVTLSLITGIRYTDGLVWQPNGASLVIDGTDSGGSDGRYRIKSSGDGSLVVDVLISSLPGTDQNDADIQPTDLLNILWDDYDREDSFDGAIEYRCIYIKNTHATDTAFSVGLFLHQDADGPDSVAIGRDPAGPGNGVTTGVATTIADDQSPPGGVSFSAPARGAAIALGNLIAGEMAAFWIRRTLPSGNTQGSTKDLSILGFFATV